MRQPMFWQNLVSMMLGPACKIVYLMLLTLFVMMRL
uniref:Uncharacterized protein n=1 Tax=Triticum urartu TaxID=4572 RepID=A0A8R7R410_TRIUA